MNKENCALKLVDEIILMVAYFKIWGVLLETEQKLDIEVCVSKFCITSLLQNT